MIMIVYLLGIFMGAITTAKMQITDTIFKMTTLKNVVPGVFETATISALLGLILLAFYRSKKKEEK